MSRRMRRLVVTGREGQVARSLLERGQGTFEIVAVGRPNLDLCQPERIKAALQQARPDVIVSAAAYTAVDRAESDEETAYRINATAPGEIAAAAARLDVPVIHLSTDYVFDGNKSAPYLETDPVGPASAYGRTKLAGERAVAGATDNHVILRTAWVYSPFGRNFLKTILHLAESHDHINVVDDQTGNPTSALDIADAILTVAGNVLASEAAPLRGLFHMTGSGEASWADFAMEILATAACHNGPTAVIGRIPTSAYPTPARRPANSRLDWRKLEEAHGIHLHDWRQATAETVVRLLRESGRS